MPASRQVVGISLFSQAVTEWQSLRTCLIVNGAWEGALRDEARRLMGELGAGRARPWANHFFRGGAFARRAIAVPHVEHVGRAVRARRYRGGDRLAGREVSASRLRRARWVAGACGSSFAPLLVRCCWCARCRSCCPKVRRHGIRGRRVFLGARAGGPRVLTAADPEACFETRFLPLLVADYLALHLRFTARWCWRGRPGPGVCPRGGA